MTVKEGLEQHRTLGDVSDEEKFFDSSSTLSGGCSFILPLLELISATSREMKAVSMNTHSKCKFTRVFHETQKANDFQKHA